MPDSPLLTFSPEPNRKNTPVSKIKNNLWKLKLTLITKWASRNLKMVDRPVSPKRTRAEIDGRLVEVQNELSDLGTKRVALLNRGASHHDVWFVTQAIDNLLDERLRLDRELCALELEVMQ